MKRILYLAMAALMVLAVSCKKDPKDPIAPDDDNTFPVPEAVDLGTVVNGKTVKWASFNLGASTEYEYGKYYAWGELEPKSNYTWTNYAHGGSGNLIIKYSPDTEEGAHRWDFDKKPDGPDGLVTLLPVDDVAAVKLGGKWRMPTKEDFEALLALKDKAAQANPEYKWEPLVASALIGSEVVKGLRITRIATNATLFIPAGGYDPYIGESGNVVTEELDQKGVYWSSSLDPENPTYAWGFSFTSDRSKIDNNSRGSGFLIRPVYED